MSNDDSDEIDSTTWPKTVSEAAVRILAGFTPSERAALASMTDDELLGQHFGMGMQIRNVFGLHGGNAALLDDCRCNFGAWLADDASQTILRAARDLARSQQV